MLFSFYIFVECIPSHFEKMMAFVQNTVSDIWVLGSVWIGLILLKLKIYCWNHCSKIIYKCVNNPVRPIFNEKIDKKWNLWVHEQYTNVLFTRKSQHLRLLFMQQYMNSNRIPPKTREKKKWRKTQLQ